MIEMDLFPLGLLLFLVGLTFLLITYFILRAVPNLRPKTKTPKQIAISPEISSHHDAVLIVNSGGHVSYINDEARTLFHFKDTKLNLEQLARHTHPIDSFLGLCAAEGQARFSINGVRVEGTSYAYSELQDNALLISIRTQNSPIQTGDDAEATNHTFKVMRNLGQSLASNMNLEATIKAILSATEQLIQADFMEASIWDEENQWLVPYRIIRNHGLDFHLEMMEDRYLLGDGPAGYIAKTLEPLLIDNVAEHQSTYPFLDLGKYQSYLGCPVKINHKIIGTIELKSNTSNAYTKNDLDILQMISGPAAIALHNAITNQKEQQRTNELTHRLALLNRFSNQISNTLDTDKLMRVTIEEIQQAIPGTTASLVIAESDVMMLRAELSPIGEELPVQLPNTPIFDALKNTKDIFSTQDIEGEERLAPLYGFFEERGTKALLILPLTISEALFGFILVQSSILRNFSSDEIDLGRILVNQASVAFQNANQFVETRQLTEDLEQRVIQRTKQLEDEHQRSQTLLQIMQELSASLDLDQVLNRTLAMLNETIGAQQSMILLLHPDDNSFSYRAALGYKELPSTDQHPSVKPRDQELASWVIDHRENTLIDDLQTDARWLQEEKIKYRSAIAAPLMVGAESLGAILLYHDQPGGFSSDHRELVQAAAIQIAVAINNTELFNLIREQAESLGGMLRNQQIEASRSMAILEAVADGVLVTDPQNAITLFNNSAQQILDLDRQTVVGKSLDEFTGLFGGAARSWMETIHQWTNDPDTFNTGDIYAERIKLDNDRVVSIHLAPVVMGNEFLGTVSVFRDITHQVAIDRLKSEFVATVSHELRTPMTSIKGYVEVLLMGAAGDLTEQQTAFLNVVKTNTERLNILVSDLLDVSRIEAGKVTLSIQPLDIHKIAKEVIQEQKRRCAENGKLMEFHLEVEPDFPRIPGDPERVHQILTNLVDNAFNYTPTDGKIEVQAHMVGKEAQIDIIDNGIGIKPEDSKRIFERFFRGEDSLVLASSGNGLGLSITQQLIEMHHGRIWMKSNGIPGDGSVFSFTLPLHIKTEDKE